MADLVTFVDDWRKELPERMLEVSSGRHGNTPA
jgi:hypothetical protein